MTEDRIGWLKGIIKTYEEDAGTFGLTASDESRLSAWRKELAELSKSNVDKNNQGK